MQHNNFSMLSDQDANNCGKFAIAMAIRDMDTIVDIKVIGNPPGKIIMAHPYECKLLDDAENQYRNGQ